MFDCLESIDEVFLAALFILNMFSFLCIFFLPHCFMFWACWLPSTGSSVITLLVYICNAQFISDHLPDHVCTHGAKRSCIILTCAASICMTQVLFSKPGVYLLLGNLGRLLLVQNFGELQILLKCSCIFPPDLYLHTTLSRRSVGSFLDLITWFLLWAPVKLLKHHKNHWYK